MYELTSSIYTYWPFFILHIDYFEKLSRHLDFYCSGKNNKEWKIVFDFETLKALNTEFLRLFKPTQFLWVPGKVLSVWYSCKKLEGKRATNMNAKQPDFDDNEICNT